jgi:hypothetical protein
MRIDGAVAGERIAILLVTISPALGSGSKPPGSCKSLKRRTGRSAWKFAEERSLVIRYCVQILLQLEDL